MPSIRFSLHQLPVIRAPNLDDLLSNPESLNQFFLDSSQSGTVSSFYAFVNVNTTTLGRACFDLDPDFEMVTDLSLTHLLTCRRVISPDWNPEDQTIKLSLRSQLSPTRVQTRMDDHVFKTLFYSTVDWFAGEECSHVIVHTMSEFNSPACIFVQEYRQISSDHGVWGPIIPNNHLLLMLIGLLELHIQDYLGGFSKSPSSNALTGVQMKHFRKVKAKIFHLLKSVDSYNVASLDSEDSQRALTGKLMF
ncbi:hypothetical protein BDN67DRAFT_982962 [Paxillus ammoniavirescens]|nr:hypothetical protein BDN67DRAFT_982962 [Paxillus ammoniavirescens]